MLTRAEIEAYVQEFSCAWVQKRKDLRTREANGEDVMCELTELHHQLMKIKALNRMVHSEDVAFTDVQRCAYLFLDTIPVCPVPCFVIEDLGDLPVDNSTCPDGLIQVDIDGTPIDYFIWSEGIGWLPLYRYYLPAIDTYSQGGFDYSAPGDYSVSFDGGTTWYTDTEWADGIFFSPPLTGEEPLLVRDNATMCILEGYDIPTSSCPVPCETIDDILNLPVDDSGCPSGLIGSTIDNGVDYYIWDGAAWQPLFQTLGLNSYQTYGTLFDSDYAISFDNGAFWYTDTDWAAAITFASPLADGTHRFLVKNTITGCMYQSRGYLTEQNNTPLEMTFYDPLLDPLNNALPVVGNFLDPAVWDAFFGGTAAFEYVVALWTPGTDTATIKLYNGAPCDIPANAFFNSLNIKTFNDKGGIIGTVGDSAFEFSPSLTSFISNSATLFDTQAFYGAYNLTYLSATSCTEIRQLGLGNNLGTYASGSNLTNYFLSGVITLGQSACMYRKLTHITFPNATTLSSSVFLGNNAISNGSVIDLSSVVALGTSAASNSVFNNITGKTVTLRVPVAQATIDAGNPDGDIITLQASNTVTMDYI